MNTHLFIGKIGKDLERRSTSTGKTICEFSVAVNDSTKDAQGNYITYWYNCVAFDKTAEYLLTYGFKGALVSVVSKPTIQDYVAKDGSDKKAYKEIVNELSVLSKKVETTPQTHTNAQYKPKVDTSKVYDDNLDLPDPNITW